MHITAYCSQQTQQILLFHVKQEIKVPTFPEIKIVLIEKTCDTKDQNFPLFEIKNSYVDNAHCHTNRNSRWFSELMTLLIK